MGNDLVDEPEDDVVEDSGKKKKPKKEKSGKPGGLKNLLVMLFAMGLAVSMLPTTVLILFGMLPAWVAWYVDRRPEKYAAYTVFLLNACGVMPFILELWTKGHTISNSTAIVRDPMSWAVMYGAAGLGWLLLFAIPSVTGFLLSIRIDERIKFLRKRQKEIITEWGDEVAATERASDRYY